MTRCEGSGISERLGSGFSGRCRLRGARASGCVKALNGFGLESLELPSASATFTFRLSKAETRNVRVAFRLGLSGLDMGWAFSQVSLLFASPQL